MPRIAPDGYDVIVIPFNDISTTHTNVGSAGTAADFTDYGSPVQSCQGFLTIGSGASAGNAMYIPSTYLVNARNGSGGGPDTTISPQVSMSAWVYLRKGTTYPGELFNKQYFLNGWSNPFLTFGMQFHTTNDGTIDCYITFNGVLQSVLRTASYNAVPIGRWCHIGCTFNGTTMKIFINGVEMATGSYSGVPDYGTLGSRGLWYAGGPPGTTANQDSPTIIQDLRIANIARPQSYFANIYYSGFQL